MSVVYERPAERRTGWDGWGTLVYGTTRIPLRLLVLIGGTLVWVLAMLLVAGGEAIPAIWTNALFLVPLVLVGSVVRTVGLRWIAADAPACLFGALGAMFAAASLPTGTTAAATAARRADGGRSMSNRHITTFIESPHPRLRGSLRPASEPWCTSAAAQEVPSAGHYIGYFTGGNRISTSAKCAATISPPANCEWHGTREGGFWPWLSI